ncbi:MAG: hypothetical protein K2J70_04920 [Muribaculaceae bacterium]|nr:hypothetical protein [Muribaculaceae bacterium]
MKRIYLIVMVFVFVLLGCFSVNAKNINKMYVSRTVGKESVYHLFQQSMPPCKGTKEKLKPLQYDYTYVRKTDSISMLMSVVLTVPGRDIEVTIEAKDSFEVYPAEVIYVKPKGKNYEYRLRVMMPFEEFEAMYKDANSPFSIIVRYTFNGVGRSLCFGYDAGKWQSKYDPMRKIIEIIKLNSQKP